MKNNFPKVQLSISITFFLLSCVVFFFFFRATNNNNKAVQLKEGEWQREATKRDEIKSLDSSIEKIAKEKAELEMHFAKSSDIVPFLDTIEKLAPLSGAKADITSVDILNDHSGLMVHVRASGTFESLYKFLTLLENAPYELEFVGVDLRREVGGEVSLETPEGVVVNKKVIKPRWGATFEIKLLSFVE